MDDFRKIFFGVLVGFLLMIIVWISFLTFSGCGSSLNCPTLNGPTPEHTSIPTLVPATLPPLSLQLGPATTATAPAGGTAASPAAGSDVPKPSNPGGPGPAVNLAGNVDSGKTIFAANCAVCHAAEGKGGNPNPGSTDGTVPPLNPIDPLLISPDRTTFVTNIDLYVEHGSTPDGPGPTFSMPAWGDKKLLTPQQIADVISYVVSLNPAGSAGGAAGTPVAGSEVPKPSNPGGPGTAVNLTGNVDSGKTAFAANCAVCHGAGGKGGNPNPGSTDGTVPPLNPIDPLLVDPDRTTFVTNVDLFLEHGSTPEGPGPTFSMPAWGDKKLLTPQQIADVISYVVSLNPPATGSQAPGTAAPPPSGTSVVAATPAGTGTQTEPEPTEEVARPSNPGGPGPAVGLTGDANSGQTLFAANCQICHGTEGKGGNPNPGSSDGTIPPLNPIDSTLISADPKTFAGNIDLFIEHGSTPEGPGPTFTMPAWGDKKLLTPQQIADLMAYVMGLNK